MDKRFNRREIIQRSAVAAVSMAITSEAESEVRGQTGSKMHLGMVTYNVAKDWDLDTLLKNCHAAGLEGVEFRTTHAHGVEPTINSAKRKEVKQKCADAGLKQISLGSISEFHYTDLSLVRQNIETCRQFVENVFNGVEDGVTHYLDEGIFKEMAAEEVHPAGSALQHASVKGPVFELRNMVWGPPG